MNKISYHPMSQNFKFTTMQHLQKMIRREQIRIHYHVYLYTQTAEASIGPQAREIFFIINTKAIIIYMRKSREYKENYF